MWVIHNSVVFLFTYPPQPKSLQILYGISLPSTLTYKTLSLIKTQARCLVEIKMIIHGERRKKSAYDSKAEHIITAIQHLPRMNSNDKTKTSKENSTPPFWPPNIKNNYNIQVLPNLQTVNFTNSFQNSWGS